MVPTDIKDEIFLDNHVYFFHWAIGEYWLDTSFRLKIRSELGMANRAKIFFKKS